MDTNVTFRMDSEVKSKMATICEQLGMSVSAAFNIFANAFVRSNGMPFEVRLDEPNEETYAAMDAAENGELYGPFDSVSLLMEALNA